jgi:hypothetical protein
MNSIRKGSLKRVFGKKFRKSSLINGGIKNESKQYRSKAQ